MFPSRISNAFAGLLELADAMLAPIEADALAADRHETRPATPAPAAPRRHPHERTVRLERRRRPAPQRSAQACLSPIGQRPPHTRTADHAAG